MVDEGQLVQSRRAAEKEASREADRDRLRAGTVSVSELSRENDFFRSVDIGSFEIDAVGAVRLGAGTNEPEPSGKGKSATVGTGRAG